MHHSQLEERINEIRTTEYLKKLKCWTDLADSMEAFAGKLRQRLAALDEKAGKDNTAEDEDGDMEEEEEETEARYKKRRQRIRGRRNIDRDTVSYLHIFMYIVHRKLRIIVDMLTGQDFKEGLQSLQVCLYSTASCPGNSGVLV